MAAYPKFNKKSMEGPTDSARDDKREPKYPWVSGSADRNGASTYTYADPEKFEKSYIENFFHSAAFKVQENAEDGKNGLDNELNHESRSYNSGGSSKTTDGHQDSAALEAKGSSRENFAGDKGSAAKGQQYKGAGETSIDGSKDGGYSNHNGDTYSTTTGNRISEHTGNTASHHEGAKTQSVTGNKHNSVKGEYGIHVQGGNMDIKVDSGKFQVKSDAVLTIESVAEIILKVGGSTVTITPSGITIKTTSGDIITDAGGSTKIQKGGVSAPPTTFK